MAKKLNREKQAEVLRRTQSQRKELKKQQVLKAIQELLTQNKPLTFSNISKVAGCSISYLYKWDEITTYIHELQQKKETQLNSLDDKEPKSHSLKTLHEVAKQKIKQLETEIKELKHQNEKLRGHIVEIYELRDECERLRSQIRDNHSANSLTKIVPLRINQSKKVSSVTDTPRSSEFNADDIQLEYLDIFELINEIGININSELKQEIVSHEPHKVKLSIQAFQQYSSKKNVDNPIGCLLSMIRRESEPNIPLNSTPKASNKSSVVMSNNEKKLIPPDKLKELSTIFHKKNEQ